MKNVIKNCLATTGLALVLLAIIAMIYHGHWICIDTVFQILFANIIIHLVLYILKLFESKYYLVEILLEVGSMILILLGLGYLFHWYESLPGWILALMGIITYVVGSLIDIFHINRDIKEINRQLQYRKRNY